MSLIEKISSEVDPFHSPEKAQNGEAVAQKKLIVKEKISALLLKEGKTSFDAIVDVISDIYIDIDILRGRIADLLPDDKAVAPVVPYGSYEKPPKVVVDMRGEIVGENFYYSERDGRWTGPGKESVVVFPALRPGRYEVRIDIVDEIRPGLVDETEFSLNAHKLEGLEVDRSSGMSVKATARVLPSYELPFCYMTIRTPVVHSPAVDGLDDKRVLGIRMQKLSLNLIDDPVT